jgi:hypothetical protein
MKNRVFTVLTILLVAGLSSAIAQNIPKVVVDVPFSFFADGKTLPAGPYEFESTNDESDMIVRNTKTKESIIVPVLFMLGQRSGNEAEVVFDKVGNEHYLAEVHEPGFDGFAFKAAPGGHSHVGVKAKK